MLYAVGKALIEGDMYTIGYIEGGNLREASVYVMVEAAAKACKMPAQSKLSSLKSGGAQALKRLVKKIGSKPKRKLTAFGGKRTGGVKGACFVAGTLIATKNGLKPIEKIQAGDTVWSENPETGEKRLKKVIRTFVNETDELIHINAGLQNITTTPEHPFWVHQKGWVFAGDLHIGDILVLKDGSKVLIGRIGRELLAKPEAVYNFEVEDFHTYYVGENNVLVHNACGSAGSWSKGTFSSAGDSLQYHFKKHGSSVGANNAQQYLNKATQFSKNLKGATKKNISGGTSGVVRYYKNGKYIDMVDKTIISFGKQ